MKQKTSWQKLGLALVLLAVIIVVGYIVINQGRVKQEARQNQEQERKTISYEGVEGKNAIELLKENHQVDAQISDLGAFVSSIDGTQNSSDTFWMFYVNGKLSEVSADQYTTKTGDKIEWKYEQSPF